MMRICNQLIAGLLTVCITLACPVPGTSQAAQSSSPPAPGAIHGLARSPPQGQFCKSTSRNWKAVKEPVGCLCSGGGGQELYL